MSTKPTNTLNLHQRIAAVMADVEYLNKDKQVGEGNYSYKAVSEESVTGTVRKQMIKHGLVLFPIAQQHRHEELPRIDRYGKEAVLSLTTVDVTYKLVNIDNPAEFELIASSGTGVDPQDKGVGKAMTYAFKYALLRTFAIPTGNDPDMVHNDVLEQQAPARVVAPTPGFLTEVDVLTGRSALQNTKSKIELRELWDNMRPELRTALKADSIAAAARIDATA